MLERVLLGDNQFLGADPLILDRARESLGQLGPEEMVRVMRAAFACGAEGFVFYTYPMNLAVLKLLNDQHPESSFDMYPLFPYAREYVREATSMGTVGMLMEHVKRLTLAGKARAVFDGGLAALTMDPYRMLKMALETEVEAFLKVAPRSARLKSILLHDVIVDLSVALDLIEIIQTYTESVADKYGVKPGLATRNFSRLVKFLEKNNMPPTEVTILAPFNSIGFQMNPSRHDCEETLAQRSRLDVIGMGLMSAGILDLENALAYIKNVKNLRSVVVGAPREDHAVRTFSALSDLKKLTSTALSPNQ